jgi:DNA-binding MarR family transcriptional regulator
MHRHFFDKTLNTKEAKLFSQIFHSFAKLRNYISKTDYGGENKVLGYLGHYEHHLGSKAQVLPSEIAKQQHMTTARVSMTVKTLEKKGLVIRTNSRTDRRHVYISLTPKGRQECFKRMKIMHAKMFGILNKLPKQDLEDFIRILQTVSDFAMQEFKS